VAVKCIAKSKLVADPVDFLHDIDTLSTLDHPHVVPLLGVASNNDSFMLVRHSTHHSHSELVFLCHSMHHSHSELVLLSVIPHIIPSLNLFLAVYSISLLSLSF